ncbi:MAG: hypothetical protein JNM78_13920 [Cyclobacteriaceae bacterium]|nr:hypothetical protein [Cyclobacteriaceae bacterium]
MRAARQLTSVGVFGVVLILTAFSNFNSVKIDEHKPSGFLILIKNTDTGLELVCEEGCAWKELFFSLKRDKFQMVDQHGITLKGRNQPSKDENMSTFLFRIRKTKTGINLEAKEGTSWTMLTFSCADNPCSQYIDQNGMTTKE